MTDPVSTTRTFDRAEAESILLEAARLDDARGAEQRSAVLSRADADALTLGEIERAAAEVGIGRIAVSKAALRVALRSATAASPRVHAVHEINAVLSADALERVADDVRTHVPSSSVRITAEGLEVEMGRANGEPGSLLVKVRSRGGVSALSVWSAAPALTRVDVAGAAVLGVPAFLFPVVAASGGAWTLATTLALAAGGLVVGTGVGFGASRWRVERWNERITEAVLAIAASVERHATERVIAPTADAAPTVGDD